MQTNTLCGKRDGGLTLQEVVGLLARTLPTGL